MIDHTQTNDLCINLLRDYNVDPSAWTNSEIINLANLLHCYVATRKYPVLPKGDINAKKQNQSGSRSDTSGPNGLESTPS